MGVLRSLVRPLNRQIRVHVDEQVDQQVDQQVGDAVMPRLDQLSGQIEDVRQATVDVRRLVTDDLDASNETAALLGRTLQDLASSVESLRSELADLRARLDGGS